MIKKIIVLGLLFCSSSIFAEQERTLDPKTFVQRTLNAEKDPNFISTEGLHTLGLTATFRDKSLDKDQLKGIMIQAVLEPDRDDGHLIQIETLLDCKNAKYQSDIYFYNTQGKLTETAQEGPEPIDDTEILSNACNKINQNK